MHAKAAKAIIARGLPFFFTGDLNSGYHQLKTNNITYQHENRNLSVNILERQGNMVDSLNALKGKQGRNVRTKYLSGPGIIDHVLVSPDIDVTKYHIVSKGTASDHKVVYVTARLPRQKN
jgi:endonuclease/exonuclease/phosphatase family metal-dependent hydrolase